MNMAMFDCCDCRTGKSNIKGGLGNIVGGNCRSRRAPHPRGHAATATKQILPHQSRTAHASAPEPRSDFTATNG